MTKVIMSQEPRHGRLLTALQLAFYPAFEPKAKKRFQALISEAENARASNELTRSEKLYLKAMAEAQKSSDPSLLGQTRYGLARLYQEQQKYGEAERIFLEQLDEALNSPRASAQLHACHMSLALLYQDEGKSAEAEKHYKKALAETEREFSTEPGLYCSTARWLAKFYLEQHRYSDAEPLFQGVLEIYEADRSPDSYLPHHLGEFAQLYEAQDKYDAAEVLYLRALKFYEAFGESPGNFMIARALDNLAVFYQARGRYAEAEEYFRKSLAIVEDAVQAARCRKAWLRWRNRKEFEASMSRSQVPISTSLDKLAEIYECQQKYAEAEPLRKRSLEIKARAWGEENSWLWVDSLAAYGKALRQIGREDEATKIDERVKAIQTNYPPGSVQSSLRFMAMPIKRNLRWRFTTFINALLHPTLR